MGLRLGDTMPDFAYASTEGDSNFHAFIEGTWAILFSHPADFTPVCTTELGKVGSLGDEFTRRGVKVIGLSCDTLENHRAWNTDIEATQGSAFTFPIISDPTRDIAETLGMLDPVAKTAEGIPLPARAVFVVGPDKKLKLSILYPASTGRNFDEILRVIDSLQLTANFSVATPVQWQKGDDVIILPNISTEQAHDKFPKGVRIVETPSGKQYLRYTPDPSSS